MIFASKPPAGYVVEYPLRVMLARLGIARLYVPASNLYYVPEWANELADAAVHQESEQWAAAVAGVGLTLLHPEAGDFVREMIAVYACGGPEACLAAVEAKRKEERR